MKFITYVDKTNNNEALGILGDTGIFPLVSANIHYCNMTELIEKITPEDFKKINLLFCEKNLIPFDNIKLLAPIPHPKQDIICLGINYYAHAVEAARYKEESFGGERKFPIYFSKRITEAVAPDDYIDGHFDIVDSLDYES